VWMNLEPAIKKAREDFGRRDPQAMAVNAWVDLSPGGFQLSFLGEEYLIRYPQGEVGYLSRENAAGGHSGPKQAAPENAAPEQTVPLTVPLPVQIILLHYLAQATPAAPEGRLISFKELPGGNIYVGPFANRAIRPLLKYFGAAPEKLLAAGARFGVKPAGIGEFSVTVPALPKIPVIFVLWPGDEEFPPSGNILFDSSAPKHLPAEDYVVLCGLVLDRLKEVKLTTERI